MLSESHEMRVKKGFIVFCVFFSVVVFLNKGNLEVLKKRKEAQIITIIITTCRKKIAG